MADITRTAANARPAGDYISFPAKTSVAIGAGQPVYVAGTATSTSGGVPYVGIADANGSGTRVPRGLAAKSVGANEGLTVVKSGPFAGFTGLTPGNPYYLSDTAGELADAAGTAEVVIGWAMNETTIFVDL